MACFTFDIHRKEKRRKQNFKKRKKKKREREVAMCISLEKDFWRIVTCEVDFDGKGYLWNITGHIVLCITFIGMETCLHVEWDG